MHKTEIVLKIKKKLKSTQNTDSKLNKKLKHRVFSYKKRKLLTSAVGFF